MLSAPDDVASVLRDAAFEDIGEKAVLAESYARSLGEAAYRGNRIATGVHTNELRLVCVSMIQTFNDYLKDKANGQGVSEGKPAHDHGADQRPGDVVA